MAMQEKQPGQQKQPGTLKAVRGTRDLLPPETALWNRVEAAAREVFARYGFGEIRTPVFEDTQLFARGVGEETDIVSKEMYTWEDRDRFDERRLRERYIELGMIAGQGKYSYSEIKENVQIGDSRVDLIAKRRGVYEGKDVLVAELVEFRPEVKQFDVDRLASQVAQFLTSQIVQSKASSDDLHVLGKLVVPARSNTPINIAQKAPQKGILIEQLEGDFFLQSQRLTLRPENTAGVVRAYIEHKLGETGALQKLFYIGPQFRRERPQRGRYRQFWQIGCEVLGPVSSGSESPVRDAEVLEMLATLLDELGVRGWRLELNSVGSSEDRRRYNAALRAALEPVKARMCEDNQRRAETNPLRVLDSKEPADQEIIDALPRIADFLDDSSREHFAAVRAALDACGVAYVVNPRLVRGLDYYTRTTFEFTVADGSGLGTQNALLGGGRYDGLSEMLGGPKAPGIGFAIGEDRLILTLQAQAEAEKAREAEEMARRQAVLMESGRWTSVDAVKYWEYEKTLTGPVIAKLDAYIAPMGAERNAAALALARELRRAGLSVEVGDGTFRLKKSFEAADKVARHIVILGEDEVREGMATVKTFATGEQVKVARANLAAKLKSWGGSF
jgi:histidyl-tRNA synthetase